MKIINFDKNYHLVIAGFRFFCEFYKNDLLYSKNYLEFWDWMKNEFEITHDVNQNIIVFNNESKGSWFLIKTSSNCD